MLKVAVFGQGYVGLTLSIAASQAGHKIIGFDIDTRRIQTNSHLLRTIFSVVGFIKIPSPTLEFRSGKLYGYWIYF